MRSAGAVARTRPIMAWPSAATMVVNNASVGGIACSSNDPCNTELRLARHSLVDVSLGVRRISVGGTLARTAWDGFLKAAGRSRIRGRSRGSSAYPTSTPSSVAEGREAF